MEITILSEYFLSLHGKMGVCENQYFSYVMQCLLIVQLNYGMFEETHKKLLKISHERLFFTVNANFLRTHNKAFHERKYLVVEMWITFSLETHLNLCWISDDRKDESPCFGWTIQKLLFEYALPNVVLILNEFFFTFPVRIDYQISSCVLVTFLSIWKN